MHHFLFVDVSVESSLYRPCISLTFGYTGDLLLPHAYTPGTMLPVFLMCPLFTLVISCIPVSRTPRSTINVNLTLLYTYTQNLAPYSIFLHRYRQVMSACLAIFLPVEAKYTRDVSVPHLFSLEALRGYDNFHEPSLLSPLYY